MSLAPLLESLPERHQECLRWFARNAGRVVSWRDIKAQPHHLMSRPKGIYKPAGSRHALSVRQSLTGNYADATPVHRPDGTWFWLYYQENRDEAQRDRQFTNLGLLRCHADRVPVGALRQVKGKPGVEYLVLGVALVAGWNRGFFHLEGFSETGVAHPPGLQGALEDSRADMIVAEGLDLEEPSLESESDERRRVLASIAVRQGRPAFRRELLRQFDGACPLSGCDFEQALEAAHIRSYLGPKSNTPSNGIILRGDLHTLFDLNLIAVSPGEGRVHLSPLLSVTTYARLATARVCLPKCPDAGKRAELLEEHRRLAGL